MSEPSLESIKSFFDLSADDINGDTISFDKFRGYVTIVMNVASKCGKTATHYRSLVELWGHVKDENINILAFPCNQFRKQEPGTAEQIAAFAKSKGVEFTMMSKIDVNGTDTNIVYQYLKSQTGIKSIKWNFSTYFIIAPDGTVSEHSGVRPMDLLDTVRNLLKKRKKTDDSKDTTNDENEEKTAEIETKTKFKATTTTTTETKTETSRNTRSKRTKTT